LHDRDLCGLHLLLVHPAPMKVDPENPFIAPLTEACFLWKEAEGRQDWIETQGWYEIAHTIKRRSDIWEMTRQLSNQLRVS
jgi:hypothetical protein